MKLLSSTLQFAFLCFIFGLKDYTILNNLRGKIVIKINVFVMLIKKKEKLSFSVSQLY